MRNRLLWAALPLLAGCAATLPQYDDGNSLLVGSERESTSPPSSTAPREGLLPPGTGLGSTPAWPASTFSARRVFAQDENYSPSSLFTDNHGDFILQQDRFEPMARFDILWQPESDIKGEPGDFDLTYPAADVKVPLAVDPDTFVTLGGYFAVRSYDTSGTFTASEDNLYEIGAYLGVGTFVNEDFLLEALFYPGVYSDLDGNLNHNDYQWYFDAMGVFRTDEDLFWKIGVSHSGLFDDLEVYPLLGVSYVISAEWRIDVLLPRSAEVSYALNPSTILLANLTLEGDQYQTHSVSVPGSGSAAHVQELRIGLGAIYRFNDRVSMFGRLGTTLAGDYNYTSGDGLRSDGSLTSGAFLTLGLGIDF